MPFIITKGEAAPVLNSQATSYHSFPYTGPTNFKNESAAHVNSTTSLGQLYETVNHR